MCGWTEVTPQIHCSFILKLMRPLSGTGIMILGMTRIRNLLSIGVTYSAVESSLSQPTVDCKSCCYDCQSKQDFLCNEKGI